MMASKAVLLSLVCLALVTLVRANECPLGKHWNAFASPPACVSYDDVPFAANGNDILFTKLDEESTEQELKYTLSYSKNPQLATGARKLRAIMWDTSERIRVKVDSDGSNAGQWVLITKANNAGEYPVGEFQVPFDEALETFGDSSGWKIYFVNWAQAESTFKPETVWIWQTCAESRAFVAGGEGTHDCPAPPQGKCEYNVLGFNPWERWNLFMVPQLGRSIAGLSDGFTMEGRFAGSVVMGVDNVKIHTVVEPYIPKSEKWSVNLGLDGCTGNFKDATGIAVYNGGIETTAECDITNIANSAVEDNANGHKIVQTASPSVDLDAVKKYFVGRSWEWSHYRKDNVVDHMIDNDGARLTVRVHGKVNFFSINDAADFNKLRMIRLTGHPTGTLVLNVGGIAIAPTGPLRVAYQGKDDIAEQDVTFGRVILNAYEAIGVELDNVFEKRSREAAVQQSGQPVERDMSLRLSILAPQALLTFMLGEVRGNVIVNGIMASGGLKLHPFGTSPNVLNGVKPGTGTKKWSKTGRDGVQCLFHNL